MLNCYCLFYLLLGVALPHNMITMSVKRVIGESTANAGVMTLAMGVVMSAILHRPTHKSAELSPPVKRVGEVANWLLSGMSPLEWQVVHLTHHAYEDTEPTLEQWELVQDKYPGAPIEAFRDPHSPIIEGHLNVLAKNGITYYPKAAKAIVPYLRDLEAKKVPREEWPPHLRHVDLTQSKFEDTLDKIPHSRMAGLVLTGSVICAVRGPKVGLTTMAEYVPSVLVLGGGVNMLGHKMKVVLGRQAAVPDDEGSYASNFFKWLEGLSAGEARHGYHHKNPGDPAITSETNPLRDPSYALLKELGKHSLHGEPLVTFPKEDPGIQLVKVY
jgi:fatty-acid desaturase